MPDTVPVSRPDTVAKVIVPDTVPVSRPDTVAKVIVPDTVPVSRPDTVAKVKMDTVASVLPDSLNKKLLEMEASSEQEGELIPEALYGVRYSSDGHLMLLDPSCYPLLDKIAKRMKADPGLKLLIRVHYFLDERGEEYSRFVSKERARLVRGYFVEQDISIARFDVVGVGGDEPITTNATEQGRKQNCRSELRYIKEK